MRYLVMINLDYDNYSHDKLRSLFFEITAAMQEKGFLVDGRRFNIDAEPDEAQRLARQVLQELDQKYSTVGESIYSYIREFFGFEVDSADNLLLPPEDEIEVSELEEIDGVSFVDILNKKS